MIHLVQCPRIQSGPAQGSKYLWARTNMDLGKCPLTLKPSTCNEGKEYGYNHYQVLTTNVNVISQQIYNVKHNTDDSDIFQLPPEVVQHDHEQL